MAEPPPVTVNIRRQVIVESRGDVDDALQRDPSERGSCALHSSMTAFLDSPSNTAFFKLQSPVVLLVPSSQTDHYDTLRSNVHLCIRPEHIVSLVHDRPLLPEGLAPLYRKLAGQETISLQFTLSKRPEWVVPNLASLMPKAQEDARLLAAFQSLASAQSTTIYMPSNALSESRALSLCHAVSTSGQLHASPQHSDFQRWYPSPGGKIVPQNDIAHIVSADRPTESPPSYDNLSPSSQGQQAESESRKRKRTSSGGDETPLDDKEVLGLVDRAGQMASRLRDLILEAEKKEALLKERMGEADRRLAQLAETRAEDKEAQVEELKQYIDDRLEETRAEIREFIDDHFDELSVDVVLKTEMEDYVDEGIRAAEDDLREKLSGNGVRVIFND